MDEFVRWYNRRIHGALWLEIGENPEEAFIRKAPPESLIGLFFSHPEKISNEVENDAFYMQKNNRTLQRRFFPKALSTLKFF